MVGLDELTYIFRNNIEFASKIKHIICKYAEKLKKIGFSKVKIMNFCGTHEWTTVHYGIRSLLPANIELVAGPGCPVCITPSKYIEEAIRLALEGVKIYAFGDVYKLPSVKEVNGINNLSDAKALGCDINVVYSFFDAIKNFKSNGEALFVGIGFETTVPSYALPIYHKLIPKGFYLMSIARLTPQIADYALTTAKEKGLKPVDAIIAPGHVSTIIGAIPWAKLSEEHKIPSVISGFEPIDLLLSIAILLKAIYKREAKVEIEYRRVVKYEGNKKALKYIYSVFRRTEASWRGIGFVQDSGLVLRKEFERYDAIKRFCIKEPRKSDWAEDLHPRCECAKIVLGLSKPTDCKLFMKACTPSRPVGPCMVSIEGTCSIWARFGGGKTDEIVESLE